MKTLLRNTVVLFSSVILSLSILIFLIAFNFPHNPPGGWYQQLLPELNDASLQDMDFTDSLTGFAVTNVDNSSKSYILKTSDGGESWFTTYTDTGRSFSKVQFVNSLTGYAATLFGNGTAKLLKTTDGGNNWVRMNNPNMFTYYTDISVLSSDEIWIIFDGPFNGCVYRSTNSCLSWELKYPGQINNNPNRIYMVNSRIGFISDGNGNNRYLKKTTDSGNSWTQLPGNSGWEDIYFQDTLIGWRSVLFNLRKTTDGGQSWKTILATQNGNPSMAISKFSVISNDTIWGVGDASIYFPNLQIRAVITVTTNGGITWSYQLPDTSINIATYRLIDFTDSRHGWCSRGVVNGVHTTTGGDSIYNPFTSLKNFSQNVPDDFQLFQNFPNPFNPKTTINFEMKEPGKVILEIYGVNGKKIASLINTKKYPGMHSIIFDGSNLPSGILFYSLYVENNLIGTRKMVLIK